MKITVLGAAGKMAPGVIRDLAEAPEVKEIVLVDLESTRQVLEQRASDWGNHKACLLYTSTLPTTCRVC